MHQPAKKILIIFLCLVVFMTACSGGTVKISGTGAKSNQGNAGKDSPKTRSAVLGNEELYSVGISEADLFWQTQEAITTLISYGKTRQELETVETGSPTRNHYVRIKELEPDTVYYYKTGGADKEEFGKFMTLPEPGGKYLFSFAVCTDIHLTNTKLDAFGSLYKESWDIYNSLIDEVNQEDVDFFVVKGDVSERSEAQDYQAFVEAAKRLDCRTYLVPGNHDKHRPSWGLFFDSFSPHSSSYFSIDHHDWHFVFLDSATEDNNKGFLGPNQLKWLESDLKANSDMRTMIFMHHLVRRTVFPRSDRFFIEDSKEFLEIIDRYPIAAVHSGHAHLNKFTTRKDTDLIVTAAVVNYPIQYNVYHVYEKGYVQTSHRLQSHLDVSETSKNIMSSTYSIRFGLKPELVPGFVVGTLNDRSFMRKIVPPEK